jgi:hypothetical protein
MAETSGEPRGRLGWAVAVVIVVLVAVNVIDARVTHASLVLGPVGAAGFLAIARWAGLSWQEPAWAGELAGGSSGRRCDGRGTGSARARR